MKTLQTPLPAGSREQFDPPQRRTPARKAAQVADDPIMDILPPLVGAFVGIVILIVVGFVLVGQAGGLAALGSALLSSHAAWYLSRASAFVAYVLLWWSMILGLSITNRLARAWPGGPAAAELHEHASLLGLGFVAVHALVLLADQYIGYTLPQILLPFVGSYLPLWVGFGQVGLYLMILVTASFYVRRWIGARTWRTLHYLSFVVFVLALLHGLFTGSDSSTAWAFWMYIGTGASVVAMTIYRIFAQRQRSAAPARLVAKDAQSKA